MGKDFLSVIVEHKKQEVAAAAKRIPEARLRDAAAGRVKRPFAAAMEKPGIHIIAEIKRASPSKGAIRPDLDPAVLARQYETGGASALSVLTETAFFKGSVDDLRQARGAVSLPVLRKDFTVSAYQLVESAAVGADAVLLIVRILTPGQLGDYLGLCRELDLDCLVEVHSEADLETAVAAGARLIGINNRNLSSFETDIGNAMRMVSRMTSGQIPVAASGITDRQDIEGNLKCGIRHFLIGESLVRSADPEEHLRRLLGGGS
ncbi:MAG: indole-3-glycerol phosphate synthase TrpC [Thermodesulfobacteriota bacterium]